jgi:hypothetical protein
MCLIPNGFEEVASTANGRVSTRPLRVMHLGSFYGSRNAENLLRSLEELKHPETEFVQVGTCPESLLEHRGSVRIIVHDTVSTARAWELMQSASILYLRQHMEDPEATHVAVATKTYEYLASGLPILAECPPGDNRALIETYGGCAAVVTPGDHDALTTALRTMVARLAEYAPRVHPEFAAGFSRRVQTAKLADVLTLASCPGIQN